MNKRLTVFALALAVAITALPTSALALSPYRPSFDDEQGGREEPKEPRHETMDYKVRADVNLEARIEARIKALEAFRARIDQSERLPGDAKAEMRTYIALQLDLLRDLAERLDGGESDAEVRADLKDAHAAGSFAGGKAAITAGADRVLGIVERMENLAERLAARIEDEENAAAAEAHADFVLHIADARVSARAALDLMANVTLRTSDAAVIEENRRLFKEAKEHLREAHESLKEAREDLRVILAELDIRVTGNLEVR